jgi:thiopurine S-methyltransferase
MRAAYATPLASLLDPGTYCLLITLDYDQRQMNGPPFAVTDGEIASLYADTFSIEQLCSEDVLDDNGRFREAGLTRLHECVYRLQRK